MEIDTILLKQMIDEKMINVQKHPSYDIYIYNYTKNCIFSHTWNEITLQCRGLILDKNLNVVARPLRKFFNYEELSEEQIPNLPYKIYDKIDGSMGILYWINDVPYIATRGSFTSEQAIHATKILHKKYLNVPFNKEYTYIFEIVYPEDIKVVDYKELDDIILLAIINTKTGKEEDINLMKNYFILPEEYQCNDYKELRNLFNGENKEGFVIKFENNYRIKLKFSEYFRIFSIKNFLTEKNIFDALINNKVNELYKLIKNTDEELRIFIDNIIQKYNNIYKEIENNALEVFKSKEFNTKKEAAEYFKQFKIAPILFKMYDKSNYTNTIWNIIKKQL